MHLLGTIFSFGLIDIWCFSELDSVCETKSKQIYIINYSVVRGNGEKHVTQGNAEAHLRVFTLQYYQMYSSNRAEAWSPFMKLLTFFSMTPCRMADIRLLLGSAAGVAVLAAGTFRSWICPRCSEANTSSIVPTVMQQWRKKASFRTIQEAVLEVNETNRRGFIWKLTTLQPKHQMCWFYAPSKV